MESPHFMEYRPYSTGKFLGQSDEFGSPESRPIHRAHLLEVLQQRVPREMLSTGKRLSLIEWSLQYSILSFTDGTTATADIIIGCDGIKSTTRRCLELQDLPIYADQVVYRGYVS